MNTRLVELLTTEKVVERDGGWTPLSIAEARHVARLAVAPAETGTDATTTEVRRVLADRGYRGDDEPVHVLLGRVLDWLGARSTDPYGTGDGSYPTLAGGSS